jgi:steroid delta-isomerase-like uncharacterized protein
MSQQSGGMQGSEEQNKQTSQRVTDEAFGKGNLDVVDEAMAEGWVGHDPAMPDDVRGRSGMREMVAGYRTAFPDLSVRTEASYACGDVVVMRWTATGTQEGDFWGMSPTGKQGTITGISIDRFDPSGMIVETWVQWDALGLLQQLGAVKAPQQA